MKKILVFTDSRGQHKPAGSNHDIFGERLKNEVSDVQVDLVLCPMKWTTTLDFIEYTRRFNVGQYDWIVLYVGIVDWSPRPQTSAINQLYNNSEIANISNWNENTRDYSKKIINNKKQLFDSMFQEQRILSYFQEPFVERYEGEPTINMYSLDMAKRNIGPELEKFPNLIFINANRILTNWEGDFKRGRPKNIQITHGYSDVISSFFPKDRLIDLTVWDENEIKKFTCDNMHLTKLGSDWIFEQLVEKMNLELKSHWDKQRDFCERQINHSIAELLDMKPLERFSGAKKEKFLSSLKVEKYLATLIIGVRFSDADSYRKKNFYFLLEWLNYYYSDMFEILVVEQDSTPKLSRGDLPEGGNFRYEFLYNPQDYNRGWGYNVAADKFCTNSKVLVMMDTDVLTGHGFVSSVRDCYIGKYKIVSPYQNVYYTTEDEVELIMLNKTLSHLKNEQHIKNPVTITGGIVIADRRTFLELKGFEQYMGYSCEDRSLDVLSLGLCEVGDIKIVSEVYVHLYHPVDTVARKNFKEIYAHLQDHYHCKYDPKLTKTDFIHKFCDHPKKEDLVTLLIKKSHNFGDIDLYKNDITNLSINGQVKNIAKIENVGTLPPDFKDFDYAKREIYEAPDPDSTELERFRNAFLGQRCFIIGNGPSLNKHNLSLLSNEFTFGVNSFYYKTRETGFRPTFYVVEDSSVMKENLSEIKSYYAPFKFFPTVYKRLHPKSPNTFFFKMNRGFYEKSSTNYSIPRFSTDATKELFCGQSVTYINLQLAYFMGFTEVYLIGMDFDYVIPDSHKRTGDVLLSDTDDPNHFHKDYFGKGKTWKDPKLDRVEMNYKMAKLVFESAGRKVFNATIGGKLEIFERINYNSLFSVHEVRASTKVLKKNVKQYSLQEANQLFRQNELFDALEAYISLAENNLLSPLSFYKENLARTYSLCKKNNVRLAEDMEEKILRLIS